MEINIRITDLEALRAIGPTQITKYLIKDGWKKTEDLYRSEPDKIVAWQWEKDDNRLIQYITRSFADYPYRVRDVITALCINHEHDNHLAIYRAITIGPEQEQIVRAWTGGDPS